MALLLLANEVPTTRELFTLTHFERASSEGLLLLAGVRLLALEFKNFNAVRERVLKIVLEPIVFCVKFQFAATDERERERENSKRSDERGDAKRGAGREMEERERERDQSATEEGKN